MRIPAEVARHVREGHPWIFQEALQGRKLPGAAAAALEIVDPSGDFVAHALHDPDGTAVLRVYTRDRSLPFDRAFVTRSVEQAARLRRDALDLSPGACFRALAGEVEGVPAVNVDAYASFLVLTYYSPMAEHYHEWLVDALQRVWRPQAIYLQRRYRSVAPDKARPGAELVVGAPAPAEVVVVEGRARFVVDPTAPLSPGLFADMRDGRELVGRISSGRRVLNCFSYTGGFSLVAALHGASSVVSVDSARRAHGRARRNFSENGLSADDRRFEFITGDALATLARMADRGRRFDLVVVDPPTFSSGGKARPFSTLKDYAALTAASLGVLEAGGLLCAACNTSKLGAADFDRALARGAAEAGRRLLITERIAQPPDYPMAPGFADGSYLKVVLARAQA